MKPPLMWAGGKTRLLKHYAPIWPKGGPALYVEPFLGGAAVFGEHHEGYSAAILNDSNAELMGFYRALKNDVEGFIIAVESAFTTYLTLPTKELRKAHYYKLRDAYWAEPTPERLFVLMRLGFNGVWQTCKPHTHLFGTPAGLLNHISLSQLYTPENLREWSLALQPAKLAVGSYRELRFESEGALVYADPPYRHSFTTYGNEFTDAHQEEVIAWALERQAAGATVLLANRVEEGDTFFESRLGSHATFAYFDVTYTAGRRKRVGSGFEAKPAREFLATFLPRG